MTYAHLDFETRSPIDLKQCGTEPYFRHPDTRVLCMAWAIGDAPVALWLPGNPFPPALAKHINEGGFVVAHNAAFERCVFEFGLIEDAPCPKPAQFLCSMTLALARGMPGKLELVPQMLGGSPKERGRGLLQSCCMPIKRLLPTIRYDDRRLPELYAYCRQDVEAERSFFGTLPFYTAEEWNTYQTNERINDRGIYIDAEFCRAALQYRDAEVEEISDELRRVTGLRYVRPSSRDAIAQWIEGRMGCVPAELRAADTGKLSLAKDKRPAFLEREDLPDDVRAVMELYDSGSNTSCSKYASMLVRATGEGANWSPVGPDHEGRIRGEFTTNAAHTGRFASRGVQMHNFKRMSKEQAAESETLIERILNGEPLPKGKVISTLSTLLRPAIVAPPGRKLYGGDWSGIEARVTAWYGGAKGVLGVFKDPERDIYVETAAGMGYEDRQVGKVSTLAFGFGGGAPAFLAMARAYGVKAARYEAEIYKNRWRASNPWAPKLWAGLEKAAIRAVCRPEEPQAWSAGPGWPTITFLFDGQWLRCELPSGRVLYYFGARVSQEGERGPVLKYVVPRYVTKTGPAVAYPTWGGKLTENIVQATAADLLRRALVTLDGCGFEIIAHVHDEILGECAEDAAAEFEQRLAEVMVDAPAWASKLPLAVETWSGIAYG